MACTCYGRQHCTACDEMTCYCRRDHPTELHHATLRTIHAPNITHHSTRHDTTSHCMACRRTLHLASATYHHTAFVFDVWCDRCEALRGLGGHGGDGIVARSYFITSQFHITCTAVMCDLFHFVSCGVSSHGTTRREATR